MDLLLKTLTSWWIKGYLAFGSVFRTPVLGETKADGASIIRPLSAAMYQYPSFLTAILCWTKRPFHLPYSQKHSSLHISTTSSRDITHHLDPIHTVPPISPPSH